MLSGFVGKAQSSGTYKLTLDTQLDGSVADQVMINFDVTIQNGIINGIDNNNRTIKGNIYTDSGDKIVIFYFTDGGTKAGFCRTL